MSSSQVTWLTKYYCKKFSSSELFVVDTVLVNNLAFFNIIQVVLPVETYSRVPWLLFYLFIMHKQQKNTCKQYTTTIY